MDKILQNTWHTISKFSIHKNIYLLSVFVFSPENPICDILCFLIASYAYMTLD